MLKFFKLLFVIIIVFSVGSFANFSPNVFALDDKTEEKTTEKKAEISCEAVITNEIEAKGEEMSEAEFTKAVKKCEKKRKREENKIKCQPTGSRLSRC